MIKKPMLASAVGGDTTDPAAILEALRQLRYPVLGTPKIDGIRTVMIEGKAVSRSLKRVPNAYTRELMENHLPDGVDGEFWIADTPFEEISGAWRRSDGQPFFEYLVFDYMAGYPNEPYTSRINRLQELQLPDWCRKLIPLELNDVQDVLDFEEACLKQGYEGIMLRSPLGPYKFGRSTLREGYLLKLKRFVDAEAKVIGYQELFSNTNSASTNALGHTERSGHRSGMVGQDTLGALVCEGLTAFAGQRFNVGSGFTASVRQELWDSREQLAGRIVRYRFQDIGTKEAPRFPRFLGFRAPEDMD